MVTLKEDTVYDLLTLQFKAGNTEATFRGKDRYVMLY
jgi:hypothetical protein